MISALLRKPGILMVMEPLLSVSILPKTIRMPFSFALGPSTSSIRYLAHHGLRIDSLLSKIIKVMDSPAPAISLLKQKMTNPQNQIAKRMKCNRSANSNFYRTQIQLLLCLVSFSFCWDLIDVTLASEDSRKLSCRQFLTANGCQQCCWCRNKTAAMFSPKSDSLHLSPIQCQFWICSNWWICQSCFISTAGALVVVTVLGVSSHPVRHFAQDPHKVI